MRGIYRNLFFFFVAIGLVILFIISANKYTDNITNNIWNKTKITIVDSLNISFITTDFVEDIIAKMGLSLNKTHIDSINISLLKNEISRNKYIEEVLVYCAMDGSLNVVIEQFSPILYINKPDGLFMYNNKGESRNAIGHVIMPIPYVTTEISIDEIQEYHDREEINKITTTELIKKISKFANDLYSDELLKDLIVQININKIGDIELIPRFGVEIITYCNIANIWNSSYYTEKLTVFYNEIIHTNKVNNYKSLDLKFANQVVAKKH